MKIYQHTPTLTNYDAVSNNVIRISQILKDHGFVTSIFADNIDSPVARIALPSSRFKSSSDDIVLLHMSTGSEFYNNIKHIKGKKVIIYHNITPLRFMAELGGPVYEAVSNGLRQLKTLSKYVDYSVADSCFNAKELEDNGYKNVKVLPLIYDFSGIKSDIDLELAKSLKGHTNIIFVGRIAPNKCQHDIIKTFYFYKKYFNGKAKLYLIGNDNGYTYYKNSLERLVDRLDLEASVIFTGKVSDLHLATYYQNADLYLSMSEHEGFCVPALECMHFGLPVLAYFYSGALPETLGNGGIFFTKKNFFDVASLIDHMVNDKDLKNKIIKSQKKELERFAPEILEKKLLEIIQEVKNG